MCGRFILILEPGDLEEELDLGGIPDAYLPRYNIAPTQPVAGVRDGIERTVEMLKWGLIPHWAKDPSIGSRMINARSETLMEKHSFKNLVSSKRGLILSSGFYEWNKNPHPIYKMKQPLLFFLPGEKVFAYAALWEEWRSPTGDIIPTTTIITTRANSVLEPFHERMPVILDKDNMWEWMRPELKIPAALDLLQPYPANKMGFYPVDSMVSNPRNDNPDCIKRTQPALF